MTDSDMYPRVSWMVAADERILQLLANSGVEFKRGMVARNTGFTPDYVGQRLNVLAEKGLIAVDDSDTHPWYSANELTEKFAADELSPEDLESL